MDPITFGMMRHYAPVAANLNINYYGQVQQNVHTTEKVLVAQSNIFNMDTFQSTSTQRAVLANSNYTTFTQVSYPNLDSDLEQIWAAYSTNPYTQAYNVSAGAGITDYYIQNQNQTRSFGGINIKNSSIDTVLNTKTLDTCTVYPPTNTDNNTANATYRAAEGVGIGQLSGSTKDALFFFPYTEQKENFYDFTNGIRNVANYTYHLMRANVTTGVVETVIPNYLSSLFISPKINKAYPLDMVITVPPAETIIGIDGDSVPARDAVVEEVVYYNAGVVESASSLSIVSGGSGLSLNGSPSGSMYFYVDCVRDGQNLPIVVSGTITNGSLTSINTVFCPGGGFSPATNVTLEVDTDHWLVTFLQNGTLTSSTSSFIPTKDFISSIKTVERVVTTTPTPAIT